MIIRMMLCLLIIIAIGSPTLGQGKIAGNAGGNEREATVFSEEGSKAWSVTGPTGRFEFTVEPGEYMVAIGGRMVPYVRVEDGKTTTVTHGSDPSISMQSETWTPACLSFGQTYTATGTAFTGVGFWIPSGSTKLKLTLREDGPDGRLIGEHFTENTHQWITEIHVNSADFPTVPGNVYYMELASTEGKTWTIGTPKGPDVYAGGIAYFDGNPHPETDLGIGIKESRPGPVHAAGASGNVGYVDEGPGSGWCTVAGQSFTAGRARNVLRAYALCGFGGGIQNFIYTIYEGGPDGKALASKNARMVSDWGTTAYFLPHEVTLEPGKEYYFEYKRADGGEFYSYLSTSIYPHGKAYRDGEVVEGFSQAFGIVGEIEPGGITYPYNVTLSDVTPTSAQIAWETGTEADAVLHCGTDELVQDSITATEGLANRHSVRLTDLDPGTTYYFRPTSFTGKEGASRTWGRIESFMTLPIGDDKPQFDTPEPVSPIPAPGPRNVALVNGSFEDGSEGWQRYSEANPKEYEEAVKDYPIGDGPWGSPTSGVDGYEPRSGNLMYGWHHRAVDDPNPLVPREDWKHEIISQRINVTPGKRYVLKAWAITGDRGSGWGRDSRIRLVADPKDQGALDSVEGTGDGLATQWFALENQWKPISLHFTTEKDTAVVGVHFLQWWILDASYLYVDDITVEELD